MTRVLLAAPVRQEPEIVRLAVASWEEVARTAGADVTAVLIDDNTDPVSSALLTGLTRTATGFTVEVHRADEDLPHTSTYARTEHAHVWDSSSIGRVTAIKDALIRRVLDDPTISHLFLVDSDLVLHPKTLAHLLSHDVDVVAEVFWTRFRPAAPLMPNCWDTHPTRYDDAGSVIRLRQPGLYQVGGTGACTLFSRVALDHGLRFQAVPHLELWGEDRHLSVRAAVLGIALHVDTTYPAFHVYRTTDLEDAHEWATAGCPPAWWTEQLDGAWAAEVAALVRAQQRAVAPGLLHAGVGRARAAMRHMFPVAR